MAGWTSAKLCLALMWAMYYIVVMNRLRSDFLFAQPSFFSGVARILDLFGLFDSYNESLTPQEADARAMYADWRITGHDISDAVAQFEAEIQSEVNSKQLPLFAK